MKREEQLTHTHAAILQAAREQFLARGYQATSTREIAKEVGITQPALYHHFSDKEVIFLEVIKSVGQEVQQGILAVNDRLATAEQPDPVEALAAVTEVLTGVHPRDVFTVIHSSFRFLKPENKRQLGMVFMQDYLGPLQKFFELGIVTLQPGLSAQDAASFYLTSLSPLFNTFHHVGPADASQHDQTLALIRLILFGVAVKK
ncbi:MAG: TetR/AcrR family transcriptional regulator [Levilactobacillus sp.]|jgi:AcrR family transcriptional regulator|uniref:TetR/AcrR family transcriptional regulator n=1 Tax=Levilactobacillus suantsaiihabitans TaxID=2487722 RepID=A0A4Z0J9I0_9LACO|nr:MULTISPECIES: TetR/AcrR family transcriptional regulator [Levilactobacillus]MCH4123777.1 TetR/AcrR family transcriptional regulator [Levilactobacillus sp.]MCI1553875.1 TetR/AcrR family transcriptional regulator [Levilactobacillus sp.]MCI1599908.1 TetR/AcrR family transcriptional regulator [Levilactobacillus sp.]MCI1606491.1 TetR/AcrR family transcriptional regulator [Levilactobacillus sp.]TGD19399.1 TetR/AcrR family transcriptional regulator [Levilactobacillus suantsaiihabitans]